MDQVSATNLIGQTYGFAIGTTMATLLLRLVYRSGGADRQPRFLFAVCILIANCAGLAKNVALLLGCSHHCVLVEQFRSIGFAAAAMLPLSILIIWRDNAVSKSRRRIGKLLVYYAGCSGALIAVLLVVSVGGDSSPGYPSSLRLLISHESAGNLTFYNGLALCLAGVLILLPGTLDNITDRIAVTLMVSGLSISSVSALIETYNSLPSSFAHIVGIAKFQSIGLMVVGALFYFSRFRAADVFAKQAVRLLVGAVLSLLAALASFRAMAELANRGPAGIAATVLSVAAIVGCATFLYGRLAAWTDVLVERKIFGKPDLRLAIREFCEDLAVLDSDSSVTDAMLKLGTRVLGISPDQLSIQDVPMTDGSRQLTVPIPPQRAGPYLVVSLTGNRKILLSKEIDSLQEIALHAGRRLEELDREEERIKGVRLEGQLHRQLIESELRALRAQVNPHFLFNSLNTIASLISSDPEKAEAITLRLASIFRYVLLHADRPLTSLDEEMNFLRTYLDIEQVRFGDRLFIEFDLESSIAHTAVPSLILQPLVENAIKHGIAPKIGKSRILVQSRRQGSSILLTVEDDGIGSIGRRGQATPGIGLQNIRERLQTMYGEHASLSLIAIHTGGSRATLEIPLAE